MYLVLPWGILFLPWGISVFLPWGFWFCCDSCGPPYKIGPLQLAIHAVQNSHAGEQKSHCDKAFVPTWMSSCKGPIGCVRACTVGKQVMSPKICADAQNCALRYSADEGVVRPRGSILWYYLFVHNCSASYLTKCSEPKEFYLLLHFCVFLVLLRLLAHVRGTRSWKTHFSHLYTVREITLRTTTAPMMFVFLLEKE